MTTTESQTSETEGSTLQALVGCDHSITADATMEEVHRAFQRHGHRFMAVLDEDSHVVGLCSLSGVGMALGSRFGFAIFSKKPVREFLLADTVRIEEGTDLTDVLARVFSRPADTFYDDIVLVDHIGHFRGLIQVHTLVKLQHAMLSEKLDEVEHQEKGLREANQRLETMAREIQQANTELARARDRALEGTRLKSEFLATMSHEIRTPMNGVIGMTNLLMETQLDQEQRFFAKTVRSSAESLLTLINDILDFSKIEAGKLEINPHDFDLREIVEGSLQLLVERAANKGIELIWDLEDAVPLRAFGDSTRLRQIIVNLLGNAVKFTEEGEVVLSVRHVREVEDAAMLRFEILDTGPGISEEVQQRLFAPFMQADGSTTRRHGGTGLGLSICRRLVELMGGQIGVRSEEGEGSTFWFEIPLKHSESPSTRPPHDIEGRRLLLVISNDRLRSTLCRQLEARKIECACACSTDVALETLMEARTEGRPIDVAILDNRSEHSSAAEFATVFRNHKEFSQLRIVVLTTVGSPLKSDMMEQKGISSYLYKPVRPADIIHSVSDALENPVPAVATPEQGTSSNGSAASSSTRPGEQLNLLIVEDTPTNQAVARIFVQKLGHTCEIAKDGFEALKKLRSGHFHAVLMDCMMPEMDGFEATRKIREGAGGEANMAIPVIAMTANAMQGDRERCLEAGMNDYLSKPLRRHELHTRLDALVENLRNGSR